MSGARLCVQAVEHGEVAEGTGFAHGAGAAVVLHTRPESSEK